MVALTQSVHDAGAGHGPVALTGAAAQRTHPHLHHRAGREAGQRNRARLRREHDRRPRTRANARLHLKANGVGNRRHMHVQLGGVVVVYAR